MEKIAIFGLGNVALDCARVLLRGEDAMGRTDIARHAQEALKRSAVKHVDIIGRRGPVQVMHLCTSEYPIPSFLAYPGQASEGHRCTLPVWALSDGFSCRLRCYIVQ